MSVQYCFDINNPNNVMFDLAKLKQFVRKLYIGEVEPKFKEGAEPFEIIYVEVDQNICIIVKGKKNIARVNQIHDSLKKVNLKVNKNITLSKPYLFEAQVKTWWTDSPNVGVRWETLQQRGPYFTHLIIPYKPLGASLSYKDKLYPLSPAEEKVAAFYAKRKISEDGGGVVDKLTEDSVFNNNFWKDFQTYLTPSHRKIFKNFTLIGWQDLINKILIEKEKGLTTGDRRLKKIQDEEKKREYGFATLDGFREKVGNFTVEPAAIFYGRGLNPKRGLIKRDINPEDVTINIGENVPIPKPPVGHKWKGIVHDHNAVWLARWNDTITGDVKYVQFAAEGRFKGESDQLKYEKARKLQRHLILVRDKYMVDAASTNLIKKQLGTVLWLIDHYGIRVGGEKGADETDTVGATTLRVEHVKLEAPKYVMFDFLGKDGVRFAKKLDVPPLIFDNFAYFLQNKSGSIQVFNLINSNSVNTYLKEFDRSFTAKVFRTRLASLIMFEALKSVYIPPATNKSTTKILFNKANIQVANILNHTRSISQKAKEAVLKDEEELALLELELEQDSSLKKRITTIKTRIEAKTDILAVAISTSLTNYIDPRLVVAWSLQQHADLSSIYTTQLIKKFQWAINTTPENWNWLDSPLLGNPDLEPTEVHDMAVVEELSSSSSVESFSHIKDQGPITDYKLLLSICENPYQRPLPLNKVSKEAMDWVYPLAKLALRKNTKVLASKILVKYYELAYQ